MTRDTKVTRDTNVARLAAGGATLERLTKLETQRASAPPKSRRHRTLSAAIHTEAAEYRKSLDLEQATAAHDPKPRAVVGPQFLRGLRRKR